MEADKFRNNARAKALKYADWGAAFHNWLNKAVEFAQKDGRVTQLRPNRRPTANEITMGALYR